MIKSLTEDIEPTRSMSLKQVVLFSPKPLDKLGWIQFWRIYKISQFSWNPWDLTLKRMGGDQIDTSHIWKLAMTFWMQLGVWNLHVIFIFSVYDEGRKKNLGVLKNFFQKFFIRNFFFQKILVQKKIFFRNFSINFITKHVWDGKFELRMISAFIWYIYCECWWKIIDFQKCRQIGLLWHHILEILWITGWFSKI